MRKIVPEKLNSLSRLLKLLDDQSHSQLFYRSVFF